MSKINSKNKGSTFERKISNLLSARFESVTGIKTAFRRNPDSGSFFGGTNKVRTDTHDLSHANFGDLICPESFNFSVECKHYKTGPSFASIVKSKVTQWDQWIGQATQDAASSNKEMMLIIKYNGVDEICLLKIMLPISPIIIYNGYYIFPLVKVLELDNNLFFK